MTKFCSIILAMNIALVTDDLIQRGGQEKVVAELADLWPAAPIYTTQISEYWKEYYKQNNTRIVVSFMQKLPYGRKINRYYFPGLFHILAFERFDFSKYDMVFSISSRFAHFIHTKPKTRHIAYINSPGRMFWETSDYFDNESFGSLSLFKGIALPLISPFLSYIREIDFVAAQKPDILIANSINVQKKILKYYKRESHVIYPFIKAHQISNRISALQKDSYFVVLSRLVSWKRVDLAVKACTDLGLNLKVIGEGPHLMALEKMAGPTVEFLGAVSDEAKWSVFQSMTALIQTQREDFGIVPLEAMLCGKPVIAFRKGGTLETVVEHVTGEFFDEQSVESLKEALAKFDAVKYSTSDCIDQAVKFDVAEFRNNILRTVTANIV